MSKISRRRFVRNSLLTAAALKAWPLIAQTSTKARITGANGDIRYAVVGFNSRGTEHINGMARFIATYRMKSRGSMDTVPLEGSD